MRRVIQASTLIILSLILIQCVENTTQPVPADPGDTIAVNDTVALRVGDKVTVLPDNFEMGFDRILEDTRCPRDYMCQWPGVGVARLWLKKQGMDTVFITPKLVGTEYAVSESQLRPVDTLDMRFSLIALSPYPVDFEPVPQSEYEAQIVVNNFIYRTSQIDSVIITDQDPDSIWLDLCNISYVRTLGDTLQVNVAYSGGCEVHDFQLYMSPPGFSESYPVRAASLYIRHDAAGDVCEAEIQRTLYFDLRPVARLYQDMYGKLDPIVVNVYYYLYGYSWSRGDIYFPVDPGK